MKRIKSIDLLRIFLILIVFLCHTWQSENPIRVAIGYSTGFAMEIFFILSGCMVVLSHSRENLKTISFVKYELKKFYPEYIIAFIMGLTLEMAWNKNNLANILKLDFLKQALINLAMLQSWFKSPQIVFSFNGVSWFLSSLVFCYIMSPTAIKILKNHKNNMFIILGAILALRFAYILTMKKLGLTENLLFTNVLPPYRFLEFLCGMCIGYLFIENNKERRQNPIYQIIGVVSFLCISYYSYRYYKINYIFIIFELFLVYTLLFYEGWIDKIAELKFISKFSSIILPFYLFHQVINRSINFISNYLHSDFHQNSIIKIPVVFILATSVGFIDLQIRKSIKSRSMRIN